MAGTLYIVPTPVGNMADMTERAIEVSSSNGAFSVSKAVLLKKGARWLIHQYMQGRLPMKKTWDGVFKHDMTGVLEVAV